jgi:hypothetical protein
LRRSSSITALFFDPSRASGFRVFAAGLACFGAVSFRLAGAVFAAAGFSPRLALGAAFFWLAFVVALAGAGRDGGALWRNSGVSCGGGFCVRHGRISFRRLRLEPPIHQAGRPERQAENRLCEAIFV